MASGRDASVKSATTSQNCTEALASAVLEWFLLLILFVYALASYGITKFASYCGLKTPCLLCSRLDHVFGNKKVGYYWDMICSHHKSEISSLVLCHAHDKLVDVHRMCESCLFSFATINKSNAETYRLLVGKLGEDSYSDFDEESDSDDHNLVSSGKRNCACCNEPWTSKGYAKKLMLTRSFGSDFMDIDYSVRGPVGTYGDSQDIIAIEQFRGDSHQKIQQSDQLTRVGYIKLKVNSDSESDILLSDDDVVESLLKDEKPKENEPGIHRIPMIPKVEIADPPVISSSASNAQSDSVEAHEDSANASIDERGLDEMKSIEQEVKKTNTALSSIPELISFADMDSATDDAATPHGIMAGEETGETSKDDDFTPTDAQVIPNSESSPITTSGKSVEGIQQFSDNISQVPNLLDLGDAYKLAVANRGKQLSGLLVEQWLSKDSSKVSQDLRNLFLSTSRGLEQSFSELSPKLSINSDEPRTTEASNSSTFQSIQKRISLERNESGLSVDGSIVSEIDGESVIDRLKRQIDYDRKAVSALYKELEEERNSSAISTNQAMAMITRLQEEKATLQMEALQYLRMMEEQAEYDMEALQKTNDLLSEREKDIQDLEAELEFFRSKYPNESPSGITTELVQTENSHEINENIDRDESTTKADASDTPAEMRTGILKDAAVEIEEEKMHILSYLEKLKEKLALSSEFQDDMDLANGDHPDVEAHVQHEPEESTCEGDDLSGDRAVDKYGSAEQNDSSGQGNPSSTGHVDAIDDASPNQRHDDDGHAGRISPAISKGVDITTLKNEYSQLLERMEALESDHRFLEHAISCLQIGEEGLQFIQDIASHLRELRTAEMKDHD